MGHATRCIPIINALIKADFEPILASDGDALVLLQKEFPFLKYYKLPSYNIKYAKKGKYLKLKLLLAAPSIFLASKKEERIVAQIIVKEQISGIISDNRLGVFSKKIPSVYITHQLKVLSGITTFFTSKIHQKFIQKFDECWVPDIKVKYNLSGELGHLNTNKIKTKHIGVLSRFQPKKETLKYDLLVLLSGPEPQRSLLEIKLLSELKDCQGSILFVRGVLTEKEEISASKNFKIVNYLLSKDLEVAINESDVIISRSGYSTIMDLAVLGKKAFFIPTPGQFEQEYLAERLKKMGIAPFVNQQNFTKENLKEITKYSGFNSIKTEIDLNLFKLFQGK